MNWKPSDIRIPRFIKEDNTKFNNFKQFISLLSDYIKNGYNIKFPSMVLRSKDKMIGFLWENNDNVLFIEINTNLCLYYFHDPYMDLICMENKEDITYILKDENVEDLNKYIEFILSTIINNEKIK